VSPASARREALERELAAAQRRGALGPASVDEQIEHSLAFAGVLTDEPQRVLDLGSGGGLPGLVLGVLAWPGSRVLLVDAQERRAVALREATARLGCEDRISVRHGRAEDLARLDGVRQGFDTVVARSFGPPAVTAECATGFLSPGGRLVVSEPPGGAGRWPPEPLAVLGLRLDDVFTGPPAFAVLTQHAPCPERFPRRAGVPARRPLWRAPSRS
jgi:16S rRNA (guanine527-N7)-methyltransferase